MSSTNAIDTSITGAIRFDFTSSAKIFDALKILLCNGFNYVNVDSVNEHIITINQGFKTSLSCLFEIYDGHESVIREIRSVDGSVNSGAIMGDVSFIKPGSKIKIRPFLNLFAEYEESSNSIKIGDAILKINNSESLILIKNGHSDILYFYNYGNNYIESFFSFKDGLLIPYRVNNNSYSYLFYIAKHNDYILYCNPQDTINKKEFSGDVKGFGDDGIILDRFFMPAFNNGLETMLYNAAFSGSPIFEIYGSVGADLGQNINGKISSFEIDKKIIFKSNMFANQKIFLTRDK